MARSDTVVAAARGIRDEYTDLYEKATLPTEKYWAAGVVEGATLLYARAAKKSVEAVEGVL